jgi:hypothetical protein
MKAINIQKSKKEGSKTKRKRNRLKTKTLENTNWRNEKFFLKVSSFFLKNSIFILAELNTAEDPNLKL